jgi:hypothetical protein
MEKQPDDAAVKTLRDAYAVRGFRLRAAIDSYDELAHPAFVLTLDRRAKKHCAAGAGSVAEAFTTAAGAGRATLDAATGTSILIFKRAASIAWPAA